MKIIILVAFLLGCLEPGSTSSVNIENRIIGGQAAREGQFPHQVSLHYNNRPVCGGSIISATYILTAAHCVRVNRTGPVIPAARLLVRVGSIKLTTGGLVVRVAEVKPHRNFANFRNDVALLKLQRRLSFNVRVRAIRINSRPVPPGTSVTISGWGGIRTGGPMVNDLRYTTLVVLRDEQCAPNSRHPSILCLGHPVGRGACQGDSGGPAVAAGQLVGAMSFTTGGCGTAQPDAYARLSNFNNWISVNSR